MADPAAAAAPTAKARGPIWRDLGFQVALSMVIGAAVGLIWPDFATSLKILGDLFLRLIRMAVAPVVFLTVAGGILAAGDIKRIGKVGVAALVYFEIVSTLALGFGMLAANLLGVGKDLGRLSTGANALKGATEAAKQAAASHVTVVQFLSNIVPDNFVGAFAKGELLQVLLIAILFGLGLLQLKARYRTEVEHGLEVVSKAFFEFIHVIMRFAPIGTFGATAYAVGANGAGVLASLAYMVAGFYLTVFLFIALVLGAVSLIFRFSLLDLLRFIREELVVVFGTASSESVLPRLLERLPAYGPSEQTVGLVLPTGYAFNLDGAAMFMSFSTIFLANAYHIPLSLQQQLGVLLVMAITSKGTAAVAGGAFVVFAATVATTGVVPLEGLALIFGVYRFMSMLSAFCNIVGNAVAVVAVAKACGEFDPDKRLALKPEA